MAAIPASFTMLLKDADGNSVAEITLFDLPAGSQAVAGATFIAPLETLLTANLKHHVDTAKRGSIPLPSAPRAAASRALALPPKRLPRSRRASTP